MPKITDLKGRAYVEFKELLETAHGKGLTGIDTEILQYPSDDNGRLVIVKATVTVDGNTFTGIGDASPASVNRMIEPHLVRMAETRAVGRAFRFAVNIGLVMKEELAGDQGGNQSDKEKAKQKGKEAVAQEWTRGDVLNYVRELEDEYGFKDPQHKYNKRAKYAGNADLDKCGDGSLKGYGRVLRDAIENPPSEGDDS